MEGRACTTTSDLKQMLAVETVEPKALPLSLLQDITHNFSDARVIGRGGFAVVYKGVIGGRAVAVKRLLDAFMDDGVFHREVECLMRVKHKNVVRFLGYCADRQGNMAPYNGKLVMADIHQRLLCFEYIPKGSLDKYIMDAYRDWRTCYEIIKGICEGLRFLHDNHIVHLDLKPANILLDDSMVPKITDFGLSRCFDENQSRDITKTILGTMGYLAPEFLKHGEITPSADLYSLGVIIIEILTGQKGYQAIGNVLETWSDRLERSQRDTLSEQIQECYGIALECTDFNPEKRPASTKDIIDRLRRTESIQTPESKDEPSHDMAAPPGQTVVRPVQAASTSTYGLVETKPPLPARLGPRGAARATRVSSMYDMVEVMQYLYVSVVKARGLPTTDITGPYVEVKVKVGDIKGVTWRVEKSPNPVWRQTFAFCRAHVQASVLEVIVTLQDKDKDKDKGTIRDDDFIGRVLFDLSVVPVRLPPESPLAPQLYSLFDADGERFGGEIMLAVWFGSQADEAFPEAWHSEARLLSPEALANRRSQVYYSPKLICLKVVVIAAQDLIGADTGRPLQPTIAKIQMGVQIRRTRPGEPQGSTNQAWNEEFMFVTSEPSENPLVVTVEEKVAAGRDQPIGRIIIPVPSPYVTRNYGTKSVPSKWFTLSRMTVDETGGPHSPSDASKHREHSKTITRNETVPHSSSDSSTATKHREHSKTITRNETAPHSPSDASTATKHREHSKTIASNETAPHSPSDASTATKHREHSKTITRNETAPHSSSDASTATKHREHSKTITSKIIPVAPRHLRRNHLSRWMHSPAKWFRLSRSRRMSVSEAAADVVTVDMAAVDEVAADEASADVVAAVDEVAADEASADVVAAVDEEAAAGEGPRSSSDASVVAVPMTFASKILVKTSLETAYHVPEESTHYSSDLQPAEQKLRKSAIGVLEVGILGARDLGDNRHPYCVAKYGTKWMRTRTLLGTASPEWNEPYSWEVLDLSTVITIAVLNNNHLLGHGSGKDQRIGKVRVRLATLQGDRVYTHYYPLMALSPSGLKKTGELHLAIRFTCTAWASMLAQYWRPPLPRMHYRKPISDVQLDYLRVQAMVIVATRLGRADPPLPREAVEYVLDVDSNMFSLRRSKANICRVTTLFSGIVAVGEWLDGISRWKNPLTTMLVQVGFVKMVCYPELILPTIFVCLITIMAWNYWWRPRGPPHIDTMLSRAEPNELELDDKSSDKLQPPHVDAMRWWCDDVSYPDELDEEFDTSPTSKPDDMVSLRYDRLRSLATMVQAVAGDLTTQAERAQSLLRWGDPRVTPVFILLSLATAILLYLTPIRVLTMAMGLYFLRPPWLRGRTNLFLNLYSRLPSNDDVML